MREQILKSNLLTTVVSPDILKGGAPIGTTRTYSDGSTYKKVADTGGKGDWEKVTKEEKKPVEVAAPTFVADKISKFDKFYDQYLDESEKVTKDESLHLKKFIKDKNPEVNMFFKHDITPEGEIKKQMDGIRSIFKKFTLKENIVTYGGIDLSNFNAEFKKKINGLEIGDDLSLKGFQSSSLKQSGIYKHLADKPEDSVVLHFHLPKGINFIPANLATVNPYDYEQEIILNHFSKFKIVGKKQEEIEGGKGYKGKGVTVLTLEYQKS